MSSKVLIIIESGKKGSNEYNFLKTFIKEIIKKDIDDIDFLSVNGWTNLTENAIEKNIRKNQLEETKVIIIFDADDPSKDNGGFKNRKNEIENKIEKIIKKFNHEIDYPLFLFPNNKDDGDFETLLENIINKDHQQLLDCFGEYEGCIEQCKQYKQYKQYNTPNRKTKMYAYITSFKHNEKNLKEVKKGNWFFNNKKYWNLDAPYLFPLKDFLEKNVNY